MTEPKYKLLHAGKMAPNRQRRFRRKKVGFYRLQALRDIPEHGVKAGDMGGYVTWKNSLSHEGSCWVGGDAQIIGKVSILEDAYVGGKATINRMYHSMTNYDPGTLEIKGNAKILDDVLIELHRYTQIYALCNKVIHGNAHISGKATLQNVKEVSDDVKIYGNAFLDALTVVKDSTEIFDEVTINAYCHISGESKIFEDVVLENNVKVVNSVIAGNAKIVADQKVIDGKLNKAKIGTSVEDLESLSQKTLTAESDLPSIEPKVNISLRIFNDVKESIASYETDIVKLIKYPAMVDNSISETLEMTMALKKAVRFSDNPDSDEFRDAVEDLDQKFVIAESNAVKMVSTILSDEEKKKTEKARDLLAIASDEASSENEKKQSFKQAFKQLEGIIAVPEVAVDTFRVKIGLKEIEA